MADPEELEDDLFDDLYEGDDVPSQPTQAAPEPAVITHEDHQPAEEPMPDMQHMNNMNNTQTKDEEHDDRMQGSWDPNQHYDGGPVENDDNYGPVGIKEDG